MGKESRVEIPENSGNFYRYEYSEGKTLYRGPVGDAPELSEEEFRRELEELITTPTITRSDLLKKARTLNIPEEAKNDYINILTTDKLIRHRWEWDEYAAKDTDWWFDMELLPDDWKLGPGKTKAFISEYYSRPSDTGGLNGSMIVVGIYKEIEEFDGKFDEGVDTGAYDVQGYLVYTQSTNQRNIEGGQVELSFPVTKLKIARSWFDDNWPEVVEEREYERKQERKARRKLKGRNR